MLISIDERAYHHAYETKSINKINYIKINKLNKQYFSTDRHLLVISQL